MAYREIVTKAIVGKGKKILKNSYDIQATQKPSTVLGCWVINHQFKGFKSGEKIGVDGSFDVNIWYSYDDDSKTTVINKKIDYNDLFNIRVKEEFDLSTDTEVIVRTLKQPVCSKVLIDGDKISFDVEKELGVEIVGETKVKISVEEEEEPWDEVIDEISDEVLKEIDNVDDDYLNQTP
ncbi:MAG: outer spore coat protein CotE [Mycoplasmatota bacterium]